MKTLISTFFLTLVILFSSCAGVKEVSDPEFRDISGVRIIKLGLLQTTAGADMVYYNPNDFGIQLADARGDVYIDNMYFGHFDLDQKVQVKKRSEFVLPVIFRLDNVSAFKNGRDIKEKKEALVRIEGFAYIKKAGFSKEIPIKYERMQNIDQLRAIVSK